ncbi:MAG: S8 family serine peptidase [Proteobacteria bacterium]|nr:S8 family serine peptidase [Pseudomonadota bacterium]MBU1060196.1 S8 family serine peptidase [Pseudomonadota bacterium]
MRQIYTLVLAVVLCCLSGFSASAIEFKNFSNQVILTPIADDQYLYPDGTKVNLTNRLVVKTTGKVSKEQLKNIDQRVTTVQELYRLPSSAYYAVTFTDKRNIAEVLHRFEISPLIDLAQPDLLQLQDESGRVGVPQQATEYIQKLNISSLWQKTKGENVKIAIIDDGFDLSHEDLEDINVAFSYDLDSKTLDASPRAPVDTHGTQVSGIIFAQHNSIGVDGIAPKAGFIAIRHTDTWTSKTLLSFYLAKLAGADIVNCSWNSSVLMQPLADIINDLTTAGRQGKGIVLVFAAGNHGLILKENYCEATLPRVLAVGAADLSGRRLPFSNYGPSVDIFTYGKNIQTLSSGPKKYAFFSGTSASAAIVSGVVALLLSQNRELTLTTLHEQLLLIFNAR